MVGNEKMMIDVGTMMYWWCIMNNGMVYANEVMYDNIVVYDNGAMIDGGWWIVN